MEIKVMREPEKVTVQIVGDIDEQGAEALKSTFREIALGHAQEVVVDFGRVLHIGSAGIGKLLVFYKDLAVHGVRLSLSNLPVAIAIVLREMRLDTIFNIQQKA